MELPNGRLPLSTGHATRLPRKFSLSRWAALVLIAFPTTFAGASPYAQQLVVGAESKETDTGRNLPGSTFPAPRFSWLALEVGSKAQVRSGTVLQWLRSQPVDYQQAVARGDLPEGEAGQRQVGMLTKALRGYYDDDPAIAAFLLSTQALPWLLELRSALGRRVTAAEGELDVQVWLASSDMQTSPKVQSVLREIEAAAYLGAAE